MAKPTDFTNFANQRPNYFPGQYLLEDDFELQHKYFSDRQLYHHQNLHLSGIIEGLEVVVIQNTKSVQIKSGSAIDSNGNLIILKEDSTFSEFKDITNGELYIQYNQVQQNQQQKDVPDSYTRWLEKPSFGFASQTPQNSVKLVKLTIKDTITLDANVREYSGLSLPNPDSKALTLRSAGNANPNLAVLTGSLKIEGDLTVSGTISGTIDTKNITSGILSVDRIPNLSADKITSGTLTVDRIPNLSANKITSGTLSVDRIPNLSADKITSGTLSVDRIPNISADKITSGTIQGNLTVSGKVNLNGNQQIVFTDADTTNNLKLQLWTGYGLGINGSTLFYTANGNHSWRDHQNNERMLLTTGADGGLTVNGNVAGKNLSLAADNSKRGTLFLATAGDYNHALYNNYSNIDGEGAWDGAKWNVYNGLNIRVGGANNAKKTTALSIDANGNVDISNLTVNKIAIGDKPVEGDTGGNRKWMKTGMKISSDTDNLFIGLKNEGSNRNDAVIAWGDDTDDDLRFINVQAKDLTEKEVLRIKANGEIQGKIWYSDEYVWRNGQASIKMGHSSKCVAFLTFVQGKFAGAGEQVYTYIESDGFWYLGGKQGSGGADIVAKARCIGSPN